MSFPSANIQKNPHKAKFFFIRSMSELLAVGYWLLAKRLKKSLVDNKKSHLNGDFLYGLYPAHRQGRGVICSVQRSR